MASEQLHESISMRFEVFLCEANGDHKLLGSAILPLDNFNSAKTTGNVYKCKIS